MWWKFEFGASLYSDPVYNGNFALNNPPYGVTNAETTFAGAQQGFKEVNWTLTSTTKYPSNCVCPNPGGVVDAGLAPKARKRFCWLRLAAV